MYNEGMVDLQAPPIFKLLANDLRWRLLIALSQSDRRVQELAEILAQPQNLVSYHLKKLQDAGMVLEHHSIADGREIYYGINLKKIHQLFKITQEVLHPALTEGNSKNPSFPPLRVLLLCTHNSARSQMAEGFLKDRSCHQIEVFSAGNDPLPLHPLAIQVMREFNIDIHEQKSKKQDVFLDQIFDYVITVCDRARETCSVFPGHPVFVHWSIPDPTAAPGPLDAKKQAFRDTALELDERIKFFLAAIPIQKKAGK